MQSEMTVEADGGARGEPLLAPFPWFGGKRRVAAEVWERFGAVNNYVEPFAGSLAVLLGRPSAPGIETVNDRNAYLANFWRALRADAPAVAAWADAPVNEADLHARHTWLRAQADFRERMLTDPDFHDAKIAGWWVWGLCAWIGDGWCKLDEVVSPTREALRLGEHGVGVHAQRVHRKLPALGNTGRGVHADRVAGADGILPYFEALAARLRRVRVCCGEWDRVLGPSVTERGGVAGVFLDPPYAPAGRVTVYAHENTGALGRAVLDYCRANGANPKLRIALCGYAGEYAILEKEGWTVHAWKAVGGYGNQGTGRGRENASRERIWFSPHCLEPERHGEFEF